MTPRECARLQGYSDSFKIIPVSDTQAYKQFGNSIVVPLVSAVAKIIIYVNNIVTDVINGKYRKRLFVIE